MRMLKKGQGKMFQIQEGIRGEVRLVERCFHLGDNVITDMINFIKQNFSDQQIQQLIT